MTKVSRRILNKHLEQYIFELFVQTIIDLKDKAAVENFLEDILSPTEKIMLIKRLAIAILLSKGYTYDKIDETVKVSRTTIMHVSYFLRYGKSGYEEVVHTILRRQKRQTLMDKIDEVLIKLSPPKAIGSIGFEKKQKVGKELYQRKLKSPML